MGDKVKRIGEMRFWLNDERDYEYNESVECIFPLYGTEESDLMSIENCYYLCRQFAGAIGFSEATINKWFGKY